MKKLKLSLKIKVKKIKKLMNYKSIIIKNIQIYFKIKF